MTESPIPGYKHDPRPDRYPTRADWPRPGTHGHHKGRPVQLMDVYHAYRALFRTGPYSTMAADLQDFVVWPFQNDPMPWTPSEIRASVPEALL
jgi:hypothetical protein